MRKGIFIICMVLVSLLVCGVTQYVNTFTNGLSEENLSITAQGNVTRYIPVPLYSSVVNMSLHMGNDTTSAEKELCYQEQSNESTACGGLDTGIYEFTILPLNRMADENYSSFYNYTGAGFERMFVNYTIPPGAIGAVFQEKDSFGSFNYTIPQSCFDFGVLNIRVQLERVGNQILKLHCFNSTGQITNIVANKDGGAGIAFYEEAIFWNYSNDVYLEVGEIDGVREWSTNNLFISENLTINNSVFNTILENNCNCTDCVISGTDCEIPFFFFSAFDIDLSYSDINLTYEWGLDDCTNFKNESLNISWFDPENRTVNIDYDTTIVFWNDPDNTSSYSTSKTDINFTQLCIFPHYANLTGNMEIEYTDQGDVMYNYFTSETSFTNVTNVLNLFTQNDTTHVLFTVLGIDSDPVANAFLHILKYDVGTGAYTITEILRTDTQGQALGNIVLGTTFYNFLVFFEGTLVYAETGVKLIATTRTFSVNLLGDDWFTNFDTTLQVLTNLYFNDTSQNFVYTFTDPSGLMHEGCLRVDKKNDTGKFTLADNCTTTTSGTIVYNIPTLENGTTYTGTGYLRYDQEDVTNIVIKKIAAVRSFFAKDKNGSLFIALIFCLVLLFMGVPNPAMSVTFLIAGVIFSAYFGLIEITSLGVGTIVLLGLIQLYLAGGQINEA